MSKITQGSTTQIDLSQSTDLIELTRLPGEDSACSSQEMPQQEQQPLQCPLLLPSQSNFQKSGTVPTPSLLGCDYLSVETNFHRDSYFRPPRTGQGMGYLRSALKSVSPPPYDTEDEYKCDKESCQ